MHMEYHNKSINVQCYLLKHTVTKTSALLRLVLNAIQNIQIYATTHRIAASESTKPLLHILHEQKATYSM